MEMTEAPALLAGPASADADAGSPLTLSSRVVGTGVACQWYRRDKTGTVTPVDGATGVNLTLPSLDASAQYSLRATASGGTVDSAWATIIARRTFAAWASVEGVPPDSGTLDSDGDGVPNLVEFALGTDPLVADAADAPALSFSPSDRLVLAFRKSREASGISLVPETSSTLAAGSWESAPVLEQQTGEADFATETREASVPLTTSRTFLRLRASQP